MKLPKHTAAAMSVRDHLANRGITKSSQERIGAFAICWGLFESSLETAVWALQNEEVNGVRPSTDKSHVSDWIAVQGNGNQDLPDATNEVLRIASIAAVDLMHYRHALMHGTLIAFPGGRSAVFQRNPRWHGEIRKRESGDAHIDDNLLDLAIVSAWTLSGVATFTSKFSVDLASAANIEGLNEDVKRAKSYAGELRHLTALMNHEKY
jgi:hypothetical protein